MPRWKSFVERFWEKVDKNGPTLRPELGPCWQWTGRTHMKHKPYGLINNNSQTFKAHRASWEMANGRAVAEGMCVLHKCDNHRCIRPSHLFEGTNDENHADKARKNRGAKKLSIADVAKIREIGYSKTQAEIGKMFGVNASTVGRIIHFARRRHVARGGVPSLSADF